MKMFEKLNLRLMKKVVVIILGFTVLVVIGLEILHLAVKPTNVQLSTSSTRQILEYFQLFTSSNSSKFNEDSQRNITGLLKEEVTEINLELSENTTFKSPYLIIPKVYNQSAARKPSNSSRKLKIINCFNCATWFITTRSKMFNRDFKMCPVSECRFTSDNNNASADVLMIFVGYLTDRTQIPKRIPGQVWVKSFWESPAHYGYPIPYEPWKNVFNWTFTYRTDSDIFAPCNRLTWRNTTDLLTDAVYYEIAKNKTRTAAWFVSNCKTPSKRENYVKKMQKYIDVDIYGKCGTLKCGSSDADRCQQKLSTTYKFYLSFENSLCKDYVTEKFFRNFQSRAHVIPVVRGGLDYKKYIPNGVFINTANFSTPKDLALYLKELGNDLKRYAQMLKEKDKLTTINYMIDWCDFCEKIHTQTESKIIPDIREWSHNKTCHAPTDI